MLHHRIAPEISFERRLFRLPFKIFYGVVITVKWDYSKMELLESVEYVRLKPYDEAKQFAKLLFFIFLLARVKVYQIYFLIVTFNTCIHFKMFKRTLVYF